MARKRGGLAGVWDRNKGAIKTLAPIAAGFIPGVGPLIGAGLGAAMGGLDRPGKGGIGLNVGGAIKGGISGYGGAKMGQAAKGGLAKMFTGGSPINKLTGAPKVGLTAGGPSSYGAIGSYQPTLAGAASMSPTAAIASAAYPGVGFSGIGAPIEGVGSFASRAMDVPPDITDFGSKYVTSMNQPLQLKPTDMIGAGKISYTTEPSRSGLNLGNVGSLFGRDGLIEQNKTLLTGLGKGVMGVRQSAIDADEADRKMAEDARQFNEMQALRMRQQSNLDQDAMMTKQQYDELNANRARLRAILTGGQ
jgi:hypothetical protein